MSTRSARVRRFGDEAIATPANFITVARLVLAVPTLLLIVDEGATWLTFSLWFVLTTTDGLDGWLARRDGTTRSGAFLDPLADKILVTGGFVALAIHGDIAWLPVLIIAAREGGVSIWRSLSGRRGISVPARRLGKWKASLQFFAVGIVLFPPTEDLPHLYNAFVWLAVALSVVSALDLVLAARRPPAAATPEGSEPPRVSESREM